MGTEKKAEQTPIEIELGQDFNPFAGMSELNKYPGSASIGYSRPILLKSISRGRITILNINETDEKAWFLRFSSTETALEPSIRDSIGSLSAEMDNLGPDSSTFENLRLVVGTDTIKMISVNVCANDPEDDRETGGFFYKFTRLGVDDDRPRDLATFIDLPSLQKLIFRFEIDLFANRN